MRNGGVISLVYVMDTRHGWVRLFLMVFLEGMLRLLHVRVDSRKVALLVEEIRTEPVFFVLGADN